jgi:hypothetical protein
MIFRRQTRLDAGLFEKFVGFPPELFGYLSQEDTVPTLMAHRKAVLSYLQSIQRY